MLLSANVVHKVLPPIFEAWMVLLHRLPSALLWQLSGGEQADARLREAAARHGIATHLDLSGSASSIAEIFVDAEGERAIYMAAGATAETRPAHLRGEHAPFIARAKSTHTPASGATVPSCSSAVPPRRTASVSRANDSAIIGLVRNVTAPPTYAPERRSRNIDAVGERPYRPDSLVRKPSTTSRSHSMRSPRSEALHAFASSVGVVAPCAIVVKTSSSTAVRMAAVC